jgi:alkanesulfonate monooxygenase SsuD/methylene tetrahydromethanopterin reductase-like flavin-dependent oxidoreductase (luciferase family)
VSYGRPLERTREYVEIIRLALAGNRVDHHGPQFELSGFKLQNAPQTSIPIYLAALGPRNVRLTGEIADGWLPIFAPRGRLGRLKMELEAGATLAHRDAGSIDVAAYIPAIVGERAERLLRQQIAYYVGGMGTFYYTFVTELGFGEETKAIREAWEGGNRLGAVNAVSDRLLDLCTLGAKGERSRQKLDEYHEQGVRLPILSFPHGSSVPEIRETLEVFAPELPA